MNNKPISCMTVSTVIEDNLLEKSSRPSCPWKRLEDAKLSLICYNIQSSFDHFQMGPFSLQVTLNQPNKSHSTALWLSFPSLNKQWRSYFVNSQKWWPWFFRLMEHHGTTNINQITILSFLSLVHIFHENPIVLAEFSFLVYSDEAISHQLAHNIAGTHMDYV